MLEPAPKLENPRELLEQAKRGNAEAYGKLYEQYLTPVYRYVYSRVWQRELAEDLTQTVFLKVFQALERFEQREVEPLAYFFTVARNTVLDYWKKKRDLPLDDGTFPEPVALGSHPSEAVDQAIARGSIEQALQELTPEQQEVVRLRFLADQPTHQVAKVMGKSEAAVRQLQSRAIKTLRKHLNSETL